MNCQSKEAELFLLPRLVILFCFRAGIRNITNAPAGNAFLFQGGYQQRDKFYFLTAHGDRLWQKREAIPTCDGNKVAVEQCSLLRSQMLFLGKSGVLYGGVLGKSEE